MDGITKTHESTDQMLSSKRSFLNGKVAVITGGARGIGAETAKLLAGNGVDVIIADILDELGAPLAESIGGRYVHCDVSKEADVESAVKFALEWRGKLDIMFNNAGIAGPGGSIADLQMDQLGSLLAINLNGVVHGIKHAARAMIAGGKGGTIICSSSSAAIMGGLASHSYSLSKSAILGLHGIRVNCVSPHGVPSEMLVSAYRMILGKTDVMADEVGKIVGERGSLLRGRGGRMEDVAQAVLFLASEDSGFVTGHNLILDGGYTSAVSQMSFIYQE
nr:short-chain dehydrogenase reductase ATA1 [Ipomoea batatas]